jgi:hypothetical protein
MEIHEKEKGASLRAPFFTVRRFYTDCYGVGITAVASFEKVLSLPLPSAAVTT